MILLEREVVVAIVLRGRRTTGNKAPD